MLSRVRGCHSLAGIYLAFQKSNHNEVSKKSCLFLLLQCLRVLSLRGHSPLLLLQRSHYAARSRSSHNSTESYSRSKWIQATLTAVKTTCPLEIFKLIARNLNSTLTQILGRRQRWRNVEALSVLMLCAPSNCRRPFSYHTKMADFEYFRVLSEKCIEYGK